MANDFTVADVLEWARTKSADETYLYGDNRNCALCQFLRETGRAANPTASSHIWNDWEKGPYAGRPTDDRSIPSDVARALTAGSFGALVARLEALVQEAPAAPSLWLNPETYLAADCGQVPA